MLDEKKISLMTKISMYEEKEENRELVISKYYKADYVRYNTLKQLVAATLVYWGVVAFYIFMKFEDMLVQINQIDYFSVMYKLLGGYVLFCFIYFVFAYFVYNYRYLVAKKGLTRYNSHLRQLIELEGGFKSKIRVIKDSDIDAFSGNMLEFDDLDDLDANNGDENKSSEPKQSIKLGNQNSSRGNVSRMAMFNQRVKEAEEEKKQQIIANANRLREREQEQIEKKNQKQKAIEEERKRIKEKRMQLEREQMEKLRMEREQRMAQNRENYTYQGGTEMNNYEDFNNDYNEGGEN